ncbi:hypothetical protein MHI18_01005 [Peribacillus sp. FSL H8-0477]|uniref:hypothetical protein n=1 Tax=Peribacillus sp. FSL H8-0477 TaxID=2921388 RepID=UPI0030FACF46
MKKIAFSSLLFVFLISSTVQALSWAITFVVWEGKVYEVKQEELIENNEIGNIIGEVTTKANDRTGSYYGNASNFYPIGTNYYQIKGTSTSNAIAIKEETQWVEAVYIHQAPFHIMNLLTHPFSVVVILVLVISGLIFRTKK